LILLLIAGFVAALVGLLPPAGHRLAHRSRHSRRRPRHGCRRSSPALAVAGVAIIALDVLRALAVMRFESRIGVAMQAALVDRVICAPRAFFRDFSSGDLALRMGSVNTVQRTITGSTIGTFVTSIFLFANLALMVAYSPALTATPWASRSWWSRSPTVVGLARLRVGPQIEAHGRQAGRDAVRDLLRHRQAARRRRRAARLPPVVREVRRVRSLNGVSVATVELGIGGAQPAAAARDRAGPVPRLAPHAGSGMTTGEFVAFHAALFASWAGALRWCPPRSTW
jgi:ATP-binding cassette subfamily C protein